VAGLDERFVDGQYRLRGTLSVCASTMGRSRSMARLTSLVRVLRLMVMPDCWMHWC